MFGTFEVFRLESFIVFAAHGAGRDDKALRNQDLVAQGRQ
jgi:hypothetical protein